MNLAEDVDLEEFVTTKDDLSGADIKSRLGLPAEVGMMARVKWDHTAFENTVGLGPVLAATYFLCA